MGCSWNRKGKQEMRPEQIKFLFFDNHTLEFVRGFTRKLGQPHKYVHNPVVKPELEHEFNRTHLYGTAVYDSFEDHFTMWYSTHFWDPDVGESDPKSYSYLCYAVSSDGISWEKPELDIVPGTNIVFDNHIGTHGPTVLVDYDEENLHKRYKLVMSPYSESRKKNGLKLFFSPDGIHWTESTAPLNLDVDSDCHIGFYRDNYSGWYRITFRTRVVDRRVWISESKDLVTWTRPVLAIEPDQLDSCDTQFYGMQLTQYGDFTLGWLSMYYTFGYEADPSFKKMVGTMDVQMAYSRDGFCWHRCLQNNRFIPNGGAGDWDENCLIPSSSAVFTRNSILFYYAGAPYYHGRGYEPETQECIGMASLRPDGFVKLEAGEEVGEIMTRPFMSRASEIFINADASQGYVILELCDQAGNAISGYDFDSCIPLTKDRVFHKCQWKQNPDPESFAGKPIRLRVRGKNVSLYSISFPNGENPEEYWNFREISCINPLYDIE